MLDSIELILMNRIPIRAFFVCLSLNIPLFQIFYLRGFWAWFIIQTDDIFVDIEKSLVICVGGIAASLSYAHILILSLWTKKYVLLAWKICLQCKVLNYILIPVIGCETIPVGRYVSDDNGTYTLLAIGLLRKK